MKLSNIQKFTIVSIALLLFTIVLFVIVPTSYFENDAITAKTELTLSVVIGIFAIVEGFSTALQYYTSINESKKDAMRYALENIYTPLFGLFALQEYPIHEEEEKVYIILQGKEAQIFKEIILKYRYLLPEEQIDLYMEEPNVGEVFLEPEVVESFKSLYHNKLEEYFEFNSSH